MRSPLIINGIDFNERLDQEKELLRKKINLQFLAFDFLDYRLSPEVESHLKQVEFFTEIIDRVIGIPRSS